MGDVKNLSSHDAAEKMKKIAMEANICMFVTKINEAPLSGRPMATQEVDDEGNIWFFSEKDSDKNRDILSDSKVQLFYSNTSKYEYMSVYGTAKVEYDKEKIDKLWTSFAKAWFKEGKDDPNLSLIKVTPEDAYYWDTKDNKMISLIKIAMNAIGITSNDDDGGIEGKLNP